MLKNAPCNFFATSILNRAFKTLLIVFGVLWVVLSAQGQATFYEDVHDFGGTVKNASGQSGLDGEGPFAGVTFDSSGNMYGTTALGGLNGGGAVWENTAAGKYLVLHSFGGTVKNADGSTGPDGSYLQGAVTLDSSGNIFGTCTYGGPNNFGLLWEITKSGTYLDLHDFGGTIKNTNGQIGPDGLTPFAAVTFDSLGNMYGTADGGGQIYQGMLWEIPKEGVYTDIHDFGLTVTNADGKPGLDGSGPAGGIVFDSLGNMYGTTAGGGPYDPSADGDGMVWEITKAGKYIDLHDFGGTTTNANGKTGPDGLNPLAAVTLDSAGDLYGTASNGGATTAPPANQHGMVWEITKAGKYLDLHDFGGAVVNADGKNGLDGGYPASSVVLDSSGNVFGTAENTGAYQCGMVWEITSSGGYRDLHDFGGYALNSNGKYEEDGQLAAPPVTFYAGNIYGTTVLGGVNDADNGGDGIVWKLGTALDAPTVSVNPTSVFGSVTATGTVKLAFALANSLTLNLTSSSGDAKVPSTVVVPPHASMVNFPITTSPVDSNVTAKITATVHVVEGSAASSENLIVKAPVLSQLIVSPSTGLVGGTTGTGYVIISSPSPAGGTVVNLSSSSPVAKVPATVVVPAGSTKSQTFAVTTSAVSKATIADISAQCGGYTANADLTVEPPYLYSLSLNPTTVTGGASSSGVVTINSGAPTGGIVITLSSTSTYATVPSSVTIPAGKTSAAFTVNTSKVSSQVNATIKATFGGLLKTVFMTIKS